MEMPYFFKFPLWNISDTVLSTKCKCDKRHIIDVDQGKGCIGKEIEWNNWSYNEKWKFTQFENCFARGPTCRIQKWVSHGQIKCCIFAKKSLCRLEIAFLLETWFSLKKHIFAENPKMINFRVALEKSRLESQKLESDETVASLQSELAATRDLLSQSRNDIETEKSNFENFKNESTKTVTNLEAQLLESKNELVPVD